MTKWVMVLVLLLSALCVSDVSYAGYAEGNAFSSGNTNTTPAQDAYGLVTRPIDGFLKAGEDVANDVLRVESPFDYETVAASQTDQVLGTTGAAGDLLHAVHCVWTAAPAAVSSIKDGTGSAINVFEVKAAAGSQTVVLDLVSADGGWKLTTSTNMTCIGIGRFS